MPDPDTPRPTSASEPAVNDRAGKPARPITPLKSALSTPPSSEAKVLCERCGGEVYRMHAVWRCPACGFKTDCCGW